MTGPLPIAGQFVMLGVTERANEANIFMLSKSMGMKELPWLLSYITVVSIGTLVFGTLFCLFLGFYVLSKSSFLLLYISTWIYTIGMTF